MCDLLKQFWDWSGITPEEYSTNGFESSKRESEEEFFLFADMIAYAKDIIVANSLTEVSVLNDLLTIMALDNECESVLDFIKDNSTDEQVGYIVSMGISHPQPEARWQLADLIEKRKIPNFLKFLYILAEDSNPYVQKRALNCIENISV